MSCAVTRAAASRSRFRAVTGAVSPIAGDTRPAVGGRDGVSEPEVGPDRRLRTESLAADVRALESEREDSAEDRDEEPEGEPEVLDGSADATPCPVAKAAPTPRAKASGPIRPTTLTQRASASCPGRPTPGFLAEPMMFSAEPGGSQALSVVCSPCVDTQGYPSHPSLERLRQASRRVLAHRRRSSPVVRRARSPPTPCDGADAGRTRRGCAGRIPALGAHRGCRPASHRPVPRCGRTRSSGFAPDG
jgi:hypothetical protein